MLVIHVGAIPRKAQQAMLCRTIGLAVASFNAVWFSTVLCKPSQVLTDENRARWQQVAHATAPISLSPCCLLCRNR